MDYSKATIAFIAILVGIVTYSVYKMLGFGPNQFPVSGKVSQCDPGDWWHESIDTADICISDRQS